MDDVTWGALTLTLTLLGAFWTWLAFHRRGLASGVRGAAFTLLPAAAWLTGTMEMFTEIGGSVADWATSLAFSPIVWAGVILTGLSVVLFGVSGALRKRELDRAEGSPPAVADGKRGKPGKPGKALPRSRGPAAPPIDDDLAEIEALLKKRGIT